jgi:hypothetical protein
MAATGPLIVRDGTINVSSAARFARLRGIGLVQCEEVDALPVRVPGPTIIAIGASRWQALSDRGRGHLAKLVGGGAVLYLRGLPQPDGLLDLAPFAQGEVKISREHRAVGYRFTASRMLPGVLAGEAVASCFFEGRGAERLPAPAEGLLMLRHADGEERAAIFGVRYGMGHVICDLHREQDDDAEAPLLVRLAVPEMRHREVGALIAADRAVHPDPERLPPFNLTIDDRPANFDHFNSAALSGLLRHIEEVCPGAHTDFGWTPRYTHPSQSYLEVMKKFATGFVWHGLWRHVDHRTIADPAAEFARGRRLANEIERRFGIRLQSIMIFPYERSAPEQFRLLLEAGFQACVEEPSYPRDLAAHLPRYLLYSLPFITHALCDFTVLYRYRMVTLTRDRMLAMAALGLPIIAYAHPLDVGLQRLSRLWDRGGDVSHFDPLLEFAMSKKLPSRSLEEIATEVRAANRASDWCGLRRNGDFADARLRHRRGAQPG